MRSPQDMFQRLHSRMSFPAFVVGTLTASALSGWFCFSIIKRKSLTEVHFDDVRPASFEEARLKAMIENAQSSSWQENLDNAMQAQERFMLPGRNHQAPDFLEKINRRGHEILREEQKQKENLASRNTKFW